MSNIEHGSTNVGNLPNNPPEFEVEFSHNA